MRWVSRAPPEISSTDTEGLGKTIQVIAFIAHLKERGIKGTHMIFVPWVWQVVADFRLTTALRRWRTGHGSLSALRPASTSKHTTAAKRNESSFATLSKGYSDQGGSRWSSHRTLRSHHMTIYPSFGRRSNLT